MGISAHPQVLPGQSYPLGATVYAVGVNFCLYAKHATSVDLLLFEADDLTEPSLVITFDPLWNLTYSYWHLFVPGLKSGQVYAYRVHGPFDPAHGHRFDATKVLLDPYTRAIVGDDIYDRSRAIGPGDNCATALKGVVVDTRNYDWQGDRPLRIPYSSSVIYEMCVESFTSNPNSGVSADKRGTFEGLIEKIPYLQDLGITAIHLRRIQQFDEQDFNPDLNEIPSFRTICWFAPHKGYSSRKDVFGPVNEFKDMVKALHKAGIEVLMTIPSNTAEGDEQGPTLSFKGLDNLTYYLLQDNQLGYKAPKAWGNAFNVNSPVSSRIIIDCLRYWVSEMHVDGFFIDFDYLDFI